MIRHLPLVPGILGQLSSVDINGSQPSIENEPIPDDILLLITLNKKDFNIDFSRKRRFNTLFNFRGISDSHREVIWCKILKIDTMDEKVKYPHLYKKLSELPNQTLD